MRKRRKRRTKTRSLAIHARRRAAQRYGVLLDEDMAAKIIRQIMAGETLYAEKQSNTISLHVIEINGVVMPIIYDKVRKALVTVLPKQILKEINWNGK